MGYEAYDSSSSRESEPADIKVRFMELWDGGDKLKALGLVMGGPISASEAEVNPNLQPILEETSSLRAYETALVAKSHEDIHGKF